MNFFASMPVAVFALTAALSMSPVDTCGRPVASIILAACVPLPAPGGPNNTMLLISVAKRHYSFNILI